MRGTLLVRSPAGRQIIEWDTEQNSGGALDPAHARQAFDLAMAQGGGGMFAFATVERTGETEQIRAGDFDPETQSRVVIQPTIAGGR